jgi:hypothetical protein
MVAGFLMTLRIQKLNIASIKIVLFLIPSFTKSKTMAKPETNKPSKKDSAKQLRKTIYGKLSTALAEHKTSMDEKDFQNSLKKASKLLSKDFSDGAAQKSKKEKKAAKKSEKKKKEIVM